MESPEVSAEKMTLPMKPPECSGGLKGRWIAMDIVNTVMSPVVRGSWSVLTEGCGKKYLEIDMLASLGSALVDCYR